jgi:hypothetical protein
MAPFLYDENDQKPWHIYILMLITQVPSPSRKTMDNSITELIINASTNKMWAAHGRKVTYWWYQWPIQKNNWRRVDVISFRKMTFRRRQPGQEKYCCNAIPLRTEQQFGINRQEIWPNQTVTGLLWPLPSFFHSNFPGKSFNNPESTLRSSSMWDRIVGFSWRKKSE